MHIRKLGVLIALTTAAGCAAAPELPAAFGADGPSGDYPQLLSRADLAALSPSAPRITPESEVGFQQRLSALQQRAAALAGPVIDAQTRQRMQAAINRAALR